ncbi:MAG: putative DNA-binding domain-containing protein [Gammaproteobacteria bacterium]
MANPTNLAQAQYEFAAHLRDPANNPAPAGLEDRRLQIYRNLFIGNVTSLLGATFPVTRKLYNKEAWRRLIRSFYSTHKSHTPLFLEVPQEFINYLQNEHTTTEDDPPFLLELAHYEWVELAISVADHAIEWDGIDPQGDLLTGIPVLSPYAQAMAYGFPVHRISTDYRPTETGTEPTRLIVYRNSQDETSFMEINPVTARLLELMEEQPGSNGRTLLEQIAAELNHPKPQTVIDSGADILNRLRQAEVLLGVQR